MVFRALSRRFKDPEVQTFLREHDERERREQAACSGHPINLHF
jgi:hypothetical protein